MNKKTFCSQPESKNFKLKKKTILCYVIEYYLTLFYLLFFFFKKNCTCLIKIIIYFLVLY